MVADLMYAILIAITIDRISGNWRWVRVPPKVDGTVKQLAVGLLGVLIVLPGMPIVTGSVVPDTRPTLPPEHVRMPTYWEDMASFVDRFPESGAMLVLPPDDYYQMPYTWGYFGNDQFISDLTI